MGSPETWKTNTISNTRYTHSFAIQYKLEVFEPQNGDATITFYDLVPRPRFIHHVFDHL